MAPQTLNLHDGFGHVAPSDVMLTHLRMLKGLINTLKNGWENEVPVVNPEDVAYSFDVLSELVRHLEEDLEFIDEHYCKKRETKEILTPPKLKKMSKTQKKKLAAV